MSTENEKQRRRPRLNSRTTEGEQISHHLIVPADMENFLTRFAVDRGLSSEVDAVRFIVRERQKREESSQRARAA